jgi:predicted acylesterase/phospholipase RssA
VDQPKDVLYAHMPDRLDALRAELTGAGARPLASSHDGRRLLWPDGDGGRGAIRLLLAAGLDEARAQFETNYFNLLVLDTRGTGEGRACSMAEDLVEALRRPAAPERAFPLSRVVVVLDHCLDLAAQTFALGRVRVRSFVVDPFRDQALRRELDEVLSRGSRVGKVALCLAGGGVEGMLFELGVLRALNAYLENRSVIDFDIFSGISAGAILASMLANRIEPTEIIRSLEGREDTIEPIGPQLLYDFDTKQAARRILDLYKTMITNPNPSRAVSRVLRAVPNGFFRGERLEALLERELTRAGRTNNFRQLRPELYVGATDQDTSDHVIFGTPGHVDVPISRAVRASCGLLPFYGPVEIDGRNYCDGQYTRTANFHLAVERGATLILVLDPLIPLRADRPGYVAEKGGVFGSIQGIKAMIHTRFTNAIAHVREAYPDVNFHIFKPDQEDMKIMSGSPMKYTVRTQIIDLAYRCAVEKIQDRADLLRVHLARHGFQLRRAPRPR